jgi:hypothetical protein
MSKIVNRVGEKYITNEGFKIEIIEYFGAFDCTIQFECGLTVNKVIYSNIKKGRIKNPNHKSVFGVGFFGQGKYKAKVQCEKTEQYNRWTDIFRRCYDKKYQEKHPTYKEVTVCEEWSNFQNFAKWYEDNYNSETMEGWCLDKDILVKGNKIYSPETCCFVPQEINKLFMKRASKRGNYPIGVWKHKGGKMVAGIVENNKSKHLGLFNTPEEAFESYKKTKESYIKEVADKWKDKLNSRVYKAMIDYQVEITD